MTRRHQAALGEFDPDDPDGPPGELGELRARLREVVHEELPAAAERNGWPLRWDHCFARVVYDEVAGGDWGKATDWGTHDGGPARESMSRGELREAVEIAESMLDEGRERVVELDRRSMERRGHEPRARSQALADAGE